MSKHTHTPAGEVHHLRFRPDLRARRVIALELPEFLVYALEQRVAEANEGCPAEEMATLNEYVESELVNLITLRDIAELDIATPGFAAAVSDWLERVER
jgi:hypothetical protein